MSDDAELRKAFDAWLAVQPKSEARASKGVLGRAERRLLGSIKHQEPRARLVASAERVRQAQLGWLKASKLKAELPTDADTEERRLRRTNLLDAQRAWEQVSVDEIIALYARRLEASR